MLLILLIFVPLTALQWEEGDLLDNTTIFFSWTAMYGLGTIANTLNSWKLKCFKTQPDGKLTIEHCSHACVIKTIFYPLASNETEGKMRYMNSTSYHCQDLDTYPPNYKHVCTNIDKEYPNLRITLYKTYLYCCEKNLCNHEGAYVAIEAQPMLQTEHKEMEDYDMALFVAACIVLALLTASPFFTVWQVAKKDAWLEKTLHSRLEKAVQLMEFKPKTKLIRLTEPVTGQLSFKELLAWFKAIRYYEHIHKPKRKVVIQNQQTVEIYDHEAGGHGHKLVRADRATWVRYDDTQQPGRATMQTVLEHGPYAYDWKPIDLVELFDQAKEFFHADEVLVEISLPVVIIGDIRGQYIDLWRWLQLVDVPPRSKLLFLGGLIDPNEPGSLDCLALVAAMKVAFPCHVFLLRGVPESIKISFGSRYGAINDAAIQSAATRLCAHLPIACRINLSILAVHSGISHLLMDYESFEEVNRPFDLESMPTLARQLIFNEPTTKIKMYREDSDTQIGHFGFQAVTRLCKEIGFNFIIRSRHHVENGIMWNEKDRLTTLWSAPGKVFKEVEGSIRVAQFGAILELDAEGQQRVYRIAAQKD